jgi:predicted DNA binding CopG/RHH family protein
MKNHKLNREEQELLNAFESGEFVSDLSKERRAFLSQAAKETFKKNKRINIRISSRDLEALKRRALEEGIPYQTLISSILHKYASGGLKDILAYKASYQTNQMSPK